MNGQEETMPPLKKPKTSSSQLSQLREMTVVVADTGDIESIKLYTPTDATTNPSLILSSAQNDNYKHLIKEAIEFAMKKENQEMYNVEHFGHLAPSRRSGRKPSPKGKKKISKVDGDDGEAMEEVENGEKVVENGEKVKCTEEVMGLIIDKVCVNFGCKILELVSGVVSTEVDARLSFDAEKSVARAKRIIKLYEDAGVAKNRILIKLASTYEGFCAAKELKKFGIKCNMTLLFSFCQAVMAAQNQVELISPFVGRIRDWYLNNAKSMTDESARSAEIKKIENASNDPGVLSVQRIYNYYKKFNINTIVMGASFRTKEEILELAGCDKLTIAPKLLKELEDSQDVIEKKLEKETAGEQCDVEHKIELDEKKFRWELNEDQMATEKLAEGIRNFAKDIVKLEDLITKML